MSSEEELDPVFKALANATRRRMLDALRDNPLTTGELCTRFPDLNRCTVMQHVGVLEAADLVIAVRRGRVRWNHLNPLPIKALHDRWIGPYAAKAVDMLAQMEADLGTDARTFVKATPS